MEVRENNIGKGLYATKKYLKDEIIHKLSGKIYDNPTRETIYIGNNKHIYDEYGIFINHSFTPTVYICETNVIALIDINENDEITFNYNDNEINMACPFTINGIAVCGK
jgi:hypothetical protein